MAVAISAAAKTFIKSQEVAVLATLAVDGSVQGATVYYRFYRGKFYFLARSDSAKTHNMLANPQVALTVFDASQIKTVQLQGKAEIETDVATKQVLFDELTRARKYQGEQLLPPVTHLDAGGYVAFRVTPTKLYYSDYKDKTQIIPHDRYGTLI